MPGVLLVNPTLHQDHQEAEILPVLPHRLVVAKTDVLRSFNDLFAFVNVRGQDRILIAAWLVGTFQFSSAFTVLVMQGEQST